METQLQATKETLLKLMASGEGLEYTNEIKFLAEAYAILCDTERLDKITDAQIRGGCFSLHEPPNEFDEEIGY